MAIAASRTARLETVVIPVFLASCFIALCAQIKIPLPFTPVPLTGQTLGVMLVGGLLGKNKGAMAVFLYLVQGMLGLPVWAGGNSSGLLYLLGPTGGYLLAHPLEAYLMGWCLERDGGPFKTMAALVIPWSVQLAIGSLWLSFFVGSGSAFFQGFYPFIAIEIAKAAFVTAFIKKVRR